MVSRITHFYQISDGGVHSHINHLLALLETAKKQQVPEVYVHFFGDGRDTAPRSATIYLKQLNDFIVKESELLLYLTHLTISWAAGLYL